jgi:hypothetical protein
MARGIFTRTLTGLQADDDAAREALRGVPIGSPVACEVTRPRNIRRHRLYWSLMQHVADAIPGNLTAENLSDVCKIETGHCTIVQGKHDTYRLPKSISFARMDEAAFGTFLDRACEFICRSWLPHMPASQLRREIEQMIGLPTEDAA